MSLKFTQANGKVSIILNEQMNTNCIEIKVIDTGKWQLILEAK